MSRTVIDTNVVELQFDKNQFINGVNTSMLAVEELKKSLQFDSNSLDSLTKAANNVDLSNIANNIDSLANRFSTFGIAGMTVIQRITNALMDLGGKMASKLMAPWRQIIDGGLSRAKNISQAQFQLQGLFGKTENGIAKLNMTMNADADTIYRLTGYTEDLVVAMDAANYAVADTAYGLDSAAKAASVLATSGVDVLRFSEDLKDANGLMRTEMQVALRSISGVAAMANSSYDEIAHVFERVSGNGRLMAIDLQSLSARGLNAAATLRDYLNEIGETANATEADIRDMVSKGKIDFMTFAKAMDSAYGEHAKDANNTFGGAFSNMKFALSKIGADFISPLRKKMIPVLNDVRMAINNVRKALNFKMKFPGLEEEVSIVDLFSRIITNLTNKIHDLFAVWMGGQDALTKGMTGLAKRLGTPYETIKNLFDELKDGTRSMSDAFDILIDKTSGGGETVDAVVKTLSENLGKTEDEIREMCKNGAISFEEFSNAVSSAFGNDVWDTRVGQLAQIFHNIFKAAINLGDALATVVGPIIKAFFDVFRGDGVEGVVGTTEALRDFTDTLRLSSKTQYSIYKVFKLLAFSIKLVAKAFGTLVLAAIRVLKELAPLGSAILELLGTLGEIAAKIINVVVDSNLLTGAIQILTHAIAALGYLLTNVISFLIDLLEPAIKAVGALFGSIAYGITSIDIGGFDAIIDRFRILIGTIFNGGTLTTLKNFSATFFGAIEKFFSGLAITFSYLSGVLSNATTIIANVCDRVISIVANLDETLKNVFKQLKAFISNLDIKTVIAFVEQVIGYVTLIGIAGTLSSVGRVVNAFARHLNAEAIYLFVTAIKTLATAILEFALAIVLLSSIPKENVESTITLLNALTRSLLALLFVYALMQVAVAKINANIIGNKLVKFLNKLAISVNNLFRKLGNAAIIASVAVMLVGFAASLLILAKAVDEFGSLDATTFSNGIGRVIVLLVLLAVLMRMLVKATNSVTNIKGNNIISIGGRSGLMGAAIFLLALLVVVKQFKKVIDEYGAAGVKDEEFKMGLQRIAMTLLVLTAGVALVGAASKRAGAGLMGATIMMLALMVVLRAMESMIEEYADLANKLGDDWWKPFSMLAGVMGLLTVMLILLAKAMRRTSHTVGSSYEWGKAFTRDSSKSPLFGMVLMMLSLAVLLKTVEGVTKGLSMVDDIAYVKMLGVLIITLGSVVAMSALMKNVSGKAFVGMTALLISVSVIIFILSNMDMSRAITAALTLTLVLGALGVAFWALSRLTVDFDSVGKTLLTISIMAAVAVIIGILNSLTTDWKVSIANGIAMGLMLASVGMALKTISEIHIKKNFLTNLGAMILLIATLGVLAWVMGQVPVADPVGLITLAGCVSLLGLVAGLILKMIGGMKLQNNFKTVIANMVAVVLALGTLMVALSICALFVRGREKELIVLSACMLLLTPLVKVMSDALKAISRNQDAFLKGLAGFSLLLLVIAGFAVVMTGIAEIGDMGRTLTLLATMGLVMAGLAVWVNMALPFFSKAAASTDMKKGLILFAAILGVIVAFAAFMSMVAQIGDPGKNIIMLVGTGVAMLALIPFLNSMADIFKELKKVNANEFKVVGLIASLLGIVAVFAFLMSGIVKLINPDVWQTVTYIAGVGVAMLAVIPFIWIASKLCKSLKEHVDLKTFAAVGLLAVLYGVVAGFAFLMAHIAQIGDVENTVKLIGGLGVAMLKLLPVILIMGVLIAAIGAILTATGGIGIAAAISGLLGMVAVVGVIAAIVWILSMMDIDENRMTSTVNALNILAVGLIQVFALFAVAGVLALAALPMSILALATLAIDAALIAVIKSMSGDALAVSAGITALTLAATGLAISSQIMTNIDLGGILAFAAALLILSLTGIGGITVLAQIAAGIAAAAAPMMQIGLMYQAVLTGINVSNYLLDSMAILAQKTNALAAVDSKGILQTSQNITKAAYNLAQASGFNYAIGMMEGLTNQSSVNSVIHAGKELGEKVDEAVRKELGIHSPSWKGRIVGQLYDMGVAEGTVDNMNLVGTAATTGMGVFGSGQMSLCGELGEMSGLSYVTNLATTIGEGIETISNTIGNVFDIFTFNYSPNDDYLAGMQNRLEGVGKAARDASNATGGMFDMGRHNRTFVENLKRDVSEIKDTIGDLDDSKQDLISAIYGESGEYAGQRWSRRMAQFMKDNEEELRKEAEERAKANNPFAVLQDELDGWIDGLDYGQTFSDLIKGLEEGFDIGAITENLDDLAGSINDVDGASGSAAKNVDKLKEAIDDLMEKYEERWDTAKENANKDLFKGVDDSGNDFLSKVQDIMDEYSKIYETAVERTNDQDLFAEVNDEDESFAPDTLLNNLEDQVNQVNELNTIIGSLSGRITDENLRAAISKMDVDDLPQLRALFRMNDSQLNDYQNMYKKKIAANQNKIQNELSGSLSQLTGEYVDVSEYITTDVGTQQLINNLQAQVDQLNIYNETVASLMDRISDVNLREAIATMGMDSLDELKKMNSMTDDQLNQYIALYQEKIQLGVTTVENELSAQLSALMEEPIDVNEFYPIYKQEMEALAAQIEADNAASSVGKAAGKSAGSGFSSGIKEEMNASKAEETGMEYTEDIAKGMQNQDAINNLMNTVDAIISMVLDPFADAAPLFTDLGKDILGAICSGIEAAMEKGQGFDETIDSVINAIVNTFEGGYENFTETGMSVVKALCDGIDSAATPEQGFDETFINIINRIETIFTEAYTDFYNIGNNICEGLAKGIEENAVKAINAANKLASDIIESTQDLMEIKSPSRVFMGIGKFIDEGLAIGLRQYAGLATDESENLANSTISAVQEAINNLSGMLDGSIDVNPTITPTLDLSEVNAKSAALANMFNGRQVAVQAQADEQQAAMVSRLGDIIAEQNAQPKQIIFNQTNNSPKALSRTEIYRQSRNAFSQLASAVT